MRNARKNRRISASRRHSVNAARNERRWLNTELSRSEAVQLKKFLDQNGIKYEASDASVIGRKITHFEIFVNNDERYMIDDFIDSIDEQNVNSSKSVKCSTRRKRPIKAAESYGWVVDEDEAWDAYEFAINSGWWTEEQLDSDIVRTLSVDELASSLAYIFRMNDFREWESRFDEDEDYEDDDE